MDKKDRQDFVLGGLLALGCAFAAVWGLLALKGWGIPQQPTWYTAVCFAAAAAALIALIFFIALRPAGKGGAAEPTLLARLLFSDPLLRAGAAKRLAYIAVMAALCIVSNMFEIKFATTQFSLTLFTSCLAGILLGAFPGACAVFLGDGIGYLVNSMGYLYYWWVALACAVMAVISGLVMRLPFRFRGGLFVKLALISLLTFLVSSVGINTTGMYFIGLGLYFPENVKEAAAELFGGRFDFWVYCLIRFVVLGQIWNSLLNDLLLFLIVPALVRTRVLGLEG